MIAIVVTVRLRRVVIGRSDRRIICWCGPCNSGGSVATGRASAHDAPRNAGTRDAPQHRHPVGTAYVMPCKRTLGDSTLLRYAKETRKLCLGLISIANESRQGLVEVEPRIDRERALLCFHVACHSLWGLECTRATLKVAEEPETRSSL